jgi:hypothetical protein
MTDHDDTHETRTNTTSIDTTTPHTLQRCVELAPGWAKAHFRLGTALLALARYVEAFRAFGDCAAAEKVCACGGLCGCGPACVRGCVGVCGWVHGRECVRVLCMHMPAAA